MNKHPPSTTRHFSESYELTGEGQEYKMESYMLDRISQYFKTTLLTTEATTGDNSRLQWAPALWRSRRPPSHLHYLVGVAVSPHHPRAAQQAAVKTTNIKSFSAHCCTCMSHTSTLTPASENFTGRVIPQKTLISWAFPWWTSDQDSNTLSREGPGLSPGQGATSHAHKCS